MISDKKSARTTGILFLFGFAGVVTAAIVTPVLTAPDYLVKASAHADRIMTGSLFQFIMAVACAGIGIVLYPVLRRYNESLALGAVAFRIIEALFQILGIVILLLLVTISREYVKTGAPLQSHYHVLGALLLAANDQANQVAVTLAWCTGALMYYSLFYKYKLIPRWLSGWGIAGISLAATASILFLFGVVGPFSTGQAALMLPISVQELVMAIWLIVKGFEAEASAAVSAMPDIKAGD